MRIIELPGKLNPSLVNQSVPRASMDIASAVEAVKPLIEEVRIGGEAALVALAKKYDQVDPTPVRVTPEELNSALNNFDPKLRAAVEESIERVRKVCQVNLPQNQKVSLGDAAEVLQRWQPVDSVGLYVPGGKAVYPSSVIMNVVPAQEAGVSRLALVSPPQLAFAGRPHPTVLATAALLGVEEVYSVGGPAAIAALAFGVESLGLAPVNLVTGPGNIYVAAAKRALKGVIGIDSEAGTTEVLIIADDSADARLIAYDLASQAEHDEAAAAVLVTPSKQLIDDVSIEIEKVAAAAENSERIRIALSGQQSALVLVDDLNSAIAFANAYATEHLQIMTLEPQKVADLVTNAGAIFLGAFSPVSLGDYMAGSNHVLPTGGQARHSSGLGVHTFLRPQQIITYQKVGLAEISERIVNFAEAEGLSGHGDAIRARFE